MERRSCSNLHFINAINGNSVLKLSNVNSCGKPALMFKKLEDVDGSEDLRTSSNGFLHSDSKFGIGTESPCLPLADRTLREVNFAKNEVVCSGNDGETGSASDDYSFGKMTLKQLKENCKTKKRIRANLTGLSPRDGQVKLEPDEDDSDLKETISSLKLKLPKAKKKCISRGSRSPKLTVSIKSEEGLDSKNPAQFHGNMASLVHVKTEVPESVLEGCESIVAFDDDSFTANQNDESSVALGASDGNPSIVECQSLEPNLFGEEYHSCALNQVSYDHLENVEPLSVLLPSSEVLMEVNNPEKSCKQFLDLPTSEFEREIRTERPLEITSPSKGHTSDTNGYSRSCNLHEFSGNSSDDHVVQVCDMVVDDSIIRNELHYDGDSCLFRDTLNKILTTNHQILTSGNPAKASSASLSLHHCSSTEVELLSSPDNETVEKQPFKCGILNRVDNNLNIEKHLDSLEDEVSLDEEKQPPTSTRIDAERDSSSWNKNCAIGETPSPSVLAQTPERLLSTRKVVSPTSQERFCLAMSSAESYDDIDRQDCKENLSDVNQTDNRSLCEGSDQHGKGSVAVHRTKFIISPSQIRRKPKHVRTSPPKGNLEGPRLSRSLPSVNTGCTSVHGCSESAIAFSRRQMHDIESLAMKLVSELKSMKDIVEEKMLFEAYRNVSLKNDADEVKNAITNATKAEEMAKKWLSMMGRDCNRFCKIMSLTQKGTTVAASTNAVQRERKKITFADEAGGMLCHVKFFENGMASFESNSVNQEDITP